MRGAHLGLLFGAVFATGCLSNDVPMVPDEPEPMDLLADANGCHGTASLDGMATTTEGGRVGFGPYLFGHARFCVHLDATQNRRAHLMIETDRFDGEHSPIAMVLESPDGTVLVEGWDVAFGMTDTKVFTNIEMPVAGGTEIDVVIVVDADGVASDVSAAFFDPLE